MDYEIGFYLTEGKPGNGKSLDQARIALELFDDYQELRERHPDLPRRRIFSNQKFSKALEDLHLNKELFYWENPKQLIQVRHADILWDEIGKDLPADGWKDTSKDIRQIFSHYRKRGNRIFANTQDYKATDINVRRMVKRAFRVQKMYGSPDISITLPEIKKKWWLFGATVWGRIIKFEYDPAYLERQSSLLALDRESVFSVRREEDEPKHIGSEGFWIRKKYVNAYDTTAEIPPYMPDALEHRRYQCPICGIVKVEHGKI